jgi:hypothetical protein
MFEYDPISRRQLAHEQAERLADEYRRAQRIHASRVPAAIRRIASAVHLGRRRRVARDPAYWH